MTMALARALMAPAPPPRVLVVERPAPPRIHRKVELIERAFELAEDAEA